MYVGIRYNKFYSTKVKDKNSMVLLVDGLGFVGKKMYIETLLLLNTLIINECRAG